MPNKASLRRNKMTIRELIERLEDIENQDREVNFIVEQYNDNTGEFEIAGEVLYTGEDIEDDRVLDIYFTQVPQD